MAHHTLSSSTALCSTLLVWSATVVNGHGYLSNPRPRQFRQASNTWNTINIHADGALLQYPDTQPPNNDVANLNGVRGGAASNTETSGYNEGDHGLCGDKGDRKAFMAGGLFGPQTPIVSYSSGGIARIVVGITAYHAGHFEFRLAVPEDGGADASLPITQSMLNEHVLEIAPSTPHYPAVLDYTGMKGYAGWTGHGGEFRCKTNAGYTDASATSPQVRWPHGSCCNGGGACSEPAQNKDRYVLEYGVNGYDKPTARSAFETLYTVDLKIPTGIACERCVLHWTYQTANSADGWPETFYNCADVAILDPGSGGDDNEEEPPTKPPTTPPLPPSPPPAGCSSSSQSCGAAVKGRRPILLEGGGNGEDNEDGVEDIATTTKEALTALATTVKSVPTTAATTTHSNNGNGNDNDNTDSSSNGKKIVGYYTNWAQYRTAPAKFFPEDVDATLLTHICYAFAMIDAANQVVPFEWNDVNEFNPAAGMYARFHAHVRKQNPSIKTLISLGGWTFNEKPETKHLFTTMASTAQSRAVFIASCIAFARLHTFDGVDIDWEYPGHLSQGGRPEDKPNFTLLLEEFRTAITDEATSTGNEALLLTIAVGAGESTVDNGYEVAKIHQHLDWIGVMTYDLHGSWESRTGQHAGLYAADTADQVSVSGGMALWEARGAPANKLVMGVASYGRGWTLASSSDNGVGAAANQASPGSAPGQYTAAAGFLSYYEIETMLATGGTATFDAVRNAMYAVKGKEWVGYDNPDTVKTKCEYALQGNYAGAMVWALDLDRFFGADAYPLLRTIKTTFAAALGGDEGDGNGNGDSAGDGDGDGDNDVPVPPTPPPPSPPPLAATTTTKAAVTTKGGSTAVCTSPAAAWGKCGGSGWTGSTCCVAGHYCEQQSQWYHQCVPDSDGGSDGGGSVPPSPPVPPSTPPPPPPPSPPSSSDSNSNCVVHAEFVAVNAESTYWPACDPNQAPKSSTPPGYIFGHYCSAQYTTELSKTLLELNLCGPDTLEIRRRFLAQVAYETGFYSTLGQPADWGAGVIHMIPANWLPNVKDMEELFPGQGILANYKGRSTQAEQTAFFKDPQFAWRSAAAWMKMTNRVIPGCGKDLFYESYDEMTRCILSRVVDRSEALRLVSKNIVS